MKTLFPLFLILMTTGCGSNNSQTTSPGTPASPATSRPAAAPDEDSTDEHSPVGCYADLAKVDFDDDMIIVFIPSLRSVMEYHERKKGAPLTESEVLAYRDQAMATALSEPVAREVDTNRGYTDIDPENCWSEWQALHGVTQPEPPRLPLTNDTASPPILDP